MATPEITLYFDYKSPYSYLAKDPAFELERELGIAINWLPYNLDIASYRGGVEERSQREWRKVRYLYMDARRWANKRGLTIRGPKKIYDSTVAHCGMLHCLRQGVLRPYHDLLFERFFLRELDIEDIAAVSAVMKEAGVNTAGFAEYVKGEGREEQARIVAEADALGVFGVPTFLVEGELFWGHDRIGLLRERLAAG